MTKFNKKSKKTRKISLKLTRKKHTRVSSKISNKFGGQIDESIDASGGGKREVTLQDCLEHLNNPNMDNLPPKICYNKLDFPNEPKTMEIEPGPTYMFFKEQFPKLISIS